MNPSYTLRNKRVWVAGDRGLVGSALVRRLQREGCEIVAAPRDQVDLRRPDQTEQWMAAARPQAVFLAAARVGGIYANDTRPAEFIYDNLMIQSTVVEASRRVGVEKLMLLGSSCIYPRLAPQPIPESALLTGPLEPTNQWYAVAKIAGIKLCQAIRRQYDRDFISAMPTNMYGPNDNYDLQNSHVLPALIRKFHEAKQSAASSVTCWGTGKPMREFLYADDLARACIFLMNHYSEEDFINVGLGGDISIKDLSELIGQIVGYEGKIIWDTDKPDGTPRKLMDSSRLFALGWKPRVDLRTGIRLAYADFLKRV
jgi:GDP-L-fucose synthase